FCFGFCRFEIGCLPPLLCSAWRVISLQSKCCFRNIVCCSSSSSASDSVGSRSAACPRCCVLPGVSSVCNRNAASAISSAVRRRLLLRILSVRDRLPAPAVVFCLACHQSSIEMLLPQYRLLFVVVFCFGFCRFEIGCLPPLLCSAWRVISLQSKCCFRNIVCCSSSSSASDS